MQRCSRSPIRWVDDPTRDDRPRERLATEAVGILSDRTGSILSPSNLLACVKQADMTMLADGQQA